MKNKITTGPAGGTRTPSTQQGAPPATLSLFPTDAALGRKAALHCPPNKKAYPPTHATTSSASAQKAMHAPAWMAASTRTASTADRRGRAGRPECGHWGGGVRREESALRSL